MPKKLKEKKMKPTKFLLLCMLLISSAAFADMTAEGGLGSGLKLPSNVDFSFFGTSGYAISNQDFAYNKISNHGTWDADSRLGAQLDWQITPRLGLVLQGELAQSLSDDHRWRPRMPWAMLRFRVTDNWVLKAGRSRLPALLYSQNANVGMSYIPARLPIEVYGLSPTFEYNGISSTYTWDVGDDGMRTLSWDLYGGFSNAWQRVWFRTNPNTFEEGAQYFARRMKAVGTFFTYEDAMENNIIRAGAHYVVVKDRHGRNFVKRNEVFTLPNGYKVYMPTGGETSDDVKFLLFGVLSDLHLGHGFYFASEFAVRRVLNMTTGLDTRAFYMQLRKKFNHFTPYVSWSYSISDSKSRKVYQELSRTTGIPQLAMYETLNRMSADAYLMANQMTFALGTAYDIGTHHRLKLEYARTKLGNGSSFVDQPLLLKSVDDIGINIFSVSYNFLF